MPVALSSQANGVNGADGQADGTSERHGAHRP
jgi:hypothetical protein